MQERWEQESTESVLKHSTFWPDTRYQLSNYCKSFSLGTTSEAPSLVRLVYVRIFPIGFTTRDSPAVGACACVWVSDWKWRSSVAHCDWCSLLESYNLFNYVQSYSSKTTKCVFEAQNGRIQYRVQHTLVAPRAEVSHYLRAWAATNTQRIYPRCPCIFFTLSYTRVAIV